MNCFTHCPSCKHAIFYGYGNGYGCYLTECKYELAEYNNGVITSNRTLTEEEIKYLLKSSIDAIPTTDVVEVVRCKDCKWFNEIGCAISIVDESDKPTENDRRKKE